jgi:hypothetical protein
MVFMEITNGVKIYYPAMLHICHLKRRLQSENDVRLERCDRNGRKNRDVRIYFKISGKYATVNIPCVMLRINGCMPIMTVTSNEQKQ